MPGIVLLRLPFPLPSAHRIGALIAAALVGPMSGIYATQAMESRHGAIDAPPGSAAETVVDRLAAQAVLSLRERHGLIADSDFAYAFSSWEEAAQNSGHAVADAWAEVFQDLEDDAILGLVDKAVAAGQVDRVSGPTPVRISHLVLRKPVAERAGRSRKRDLPALAGAASDELCEFLVDSGARQPDNLQGERRKEWASFLKVLAAKKVAAAEPATVTRALRTLRELSQWQLLRGRSGGLGDVDSIDLFAFLRDGTQAPARALSGLRWFVKLAGLGWDLSDLQPAPKLGREGPSQAAVAEPGMVEELVFAGQLVDHGWVLASPAPGEVVPGVYHTIYRSLWVLQGEAVAFASWFSLGGPVPFYGRVPLGGGVAGIIWLPAREQTPKMRYMLRQCWPPLAVPPGYPVGTGGVQRPRTSCLHVLMEEGGAFGGHIVGPRRHLPFGLRGLD